MRIALIDPSYIFKPYVLLPNIAHPTGLNYIGSTLKNAGHEIKVLDYINNKDTSLDQINDCDVVGLASYINCYDFFKENLPKIKQADKTIVVGGPLISSYGNNSNNLLMKLFPEIDYAVIGRGEITINNLVQHLETHSLPLPGGVLFRKDNQIQSTGEGVAIADLDKIPEVDYADWPDLVKNIENSTLNMTIARGCYNNCSFCYNADKKIISFSLERIDKELKKIAEFKPRKVVFSDQIFTYDKKRAIKIAGMMQKYGLAYSGITSVGHVDHELLKVFKDTGALDIIFGIESFDENILRTNKKPFNISHVYKAIEASHKADLMPTSFFIVGLPGENKKTLEKTITEIQRTKVFPFPRLLIPLPGTEIYRNALKKELIDEPALLKQFSEPDKFDTSTGNWVPINLSKDLSNKELIEGRERIYRVGAEMLDPEK